MLWFSLLVLIPLTAVVVTASEGGWAAFWQAVTNEQTAAAIRLTVGTALLVTLVNIVMGTADRLGAGARPLLRQAGPGGPHRHPVRAADDRRRPGAAVALRAATARSGVNIANTRPAVFLAFLFVTLPFVVRTVQPVLAELDREVEEAAASLGASRFTIFRRIILPSLTPAIAAGAALSFARGVSEYGSLVLLSGNLPMRTEVTSVRILSSIENDNLDGAAAVATVLLVISFAVIVLLDVIQRRVVRRG